MSELFWKEWGDNRWNIIGLTILAPIASLALKFLLLGGGEFDENSSAGGLIPAMLLLFVLAVGADLVAADTASGRVGFFAALPVHPRTLWGAKALFLFGGASVYLVYLLLMETVLLSADGVNGLRVFVPGLTKYAFLYAGVAIVGAATLFFSTLIDRGFAVAIAAIGTIALLIAIAWHLHPAPKEAGREIVATTGGWLFLALMAGSYFAFTRGRIHLGSRLRRLALAGVALALLFAAPVGVSVARAAAWLRVSAGDKDLAVDSVWAVDEAGNWALVAVKRPSEGPYGLSSPLRLVAVHLKDGRVREFSAHSEVADIEVHGFTAPDRFVWIQDQRVRGRRSPSRVRIEVDLNSGERVSARAPRPEDGPRPGRRLPNGTTVVREAKNRWEFRTPGRETVELSGTERFAGLANRWGVLIVRRTRQGPEESILHLETGKRLPLASPSLVLLPATPGGVAFARTSSAQLNRLPTDGGDPETVFQEYGGLANGSSPDGAHALVVAESSIHLLRAEGAEVIRLPQARPRHDYSEAAWDAANSRFLIRGQSWYWLGDASETHPKLRQTRIHADAGRAVWFSADRVLIWRDRLRLFTLDGHSRQLLPAKEIP